MPRKTTYVVIAGQRGDTLITQVTATSVAEAIEEAKKTYAATVSNILYVAKGRIGENLLGDE